MDFSQVWEIVKSLLPMGPVEIIQYILMALGALVVAGYAYIKATPSQEDDAWYDKMEKTPLIGAILLFLKKFSPIQRKE